MTPTFTFENIDRLTTAEMPNQLGWAITFRSLNEGMCHQLYANGRLVDWTDSPQQRSFTLPVSDKPVEVAIIAVDPDERQTNLTGYLPDEAGSFNWIHTENAVRGISHPAGNRFEMLTDRATGQFDTEPVASREIWPAWLNRWGFGEDKFALGGFGYGGSTAPGLGCGAFGAGMFGINTDTAELTAVLAETGTHQIVVRTTTPNNQYAAASTKQIAATPPPAPPDGIAVNNYDHSTGTLILEIQ